MPEQSDRATREMKIPEYYYDPIFGPLIKQVIEITDRAMNQNKRFVIQAWGQLWMIIDSQTKTMVPGSIGELDSRVLLAEIFNRRDAEDKCQNKVVPIR